MIIRLVIPAALHPAATAIMEHRLTTVTSRPAYSCMRVVEQFRPGFDVSERHPPHCVAAAARPDGPGRLRHRLRGGWADRLGSCCDGRRPEPAARSAEGSGGGEGDRARGPAPHRARRSRHLLCRTRACRTLIIPPNHCGLCVIHGSFLRKDDVILPLSRVSGHRSSAPERSRPSGSES